MSEIRIQSRVTGITLFFTLMLIAWFLRSVHAQEAIMVDEGVFQENALKVQELLSLEPYKGLPYEEIKKHMDAKQPELNRVYVALKNFVETAPGSPYADDALYVVAHMDLGRWEVRVEILARLRTQYPDAKLEPWSLEHLTAIIPPGTKRLGLASLAQVEYAEALSYARRYDAANRELRLFLDQFGQITQTDLQEAPQIMLAYMTLANNHLAQNDREGTKQVYHQALQKLPPSGAAEYFKKKLAELSQQVP